MTELAALTARAENVTRFTQWCQFTHSHGLNSSPVGELVLWTDYKTAIDALLTYATTVTNERDDMESDVDAKSEEAWVALRRQLMQAEQERDAAIASARAASQRAQHLDTIRRAIARSPENCPVCHSAMVAHVPGCIAAFDHAQLVDPPSLLGRRCFECPGTIVAACNRCGQKYATPIAQETP